MKLLIFLCLLFSTHNSYSQTYIRNVLSAGGGTATYSGNTYDWTLGDIAVETIISPETLFTQGFLQPSITPIYAPLEKSLACNISTMPNPVCDELNIVFSLPINMKILINLRDALGRIVFSDEQLLQTSTFKINTSRLIRGTYFLTITDVNLTTNSFTIIK